MYKGEWKRNLRHGKGKQTYTDQSAYDGEFQNDAPSGKGKKTYQDRSVYEGEFRNGAPTGIGKLTLSTGVVYEWNNHLPFQTEGKLFSLDILVQEAKDTIETQARSSSGKNAGI